MTYTIIKIILGFILIVLLIYELFTGKLISNKDKYYKLFLLVVIIVLIFNLIDRIILIDK